MGWRVVGHVPDPDPGSAPDPLRDASAIVAWRRARRRSPRGCRPDASELLTSRSTDCSMDAERPRGIATPRDTDVPAVALRRARRSWTTERWRPEAAASSKRSRSSACGLAVRSWSPRSPRRSCDRAAARSRARAFGAPARRRGSITWPAASRRGRCPARPLVVRIHPCPAGHDAGREHPRPSLDPDPSTCGPGRSPWATWRSSDAGASVRCLDLRPCSSSCRAGR